MLTSYEFVSAWLTSRLAKDERGASLVEYALLVALIAVVCIAAVTFLGAVEVRLGGNRHQRRLLSASRTARARGTDRLSPGPVAPRGRVAPTRARIPPSARLPRCPSSDD